MPLPLLYLTRSRNERTRMIFIIRWQNLCERTKENGMMIHRLKTICHRRSQNLSVFFFSTVIHRQTCTEFVCTFARIAISPERRELPKSKKYTRSVRGRLTTQDNETLNLRTSLIKQNDENRKSNAIRVECLYLHFTMP